MNRPLCIYHKNCADGFTAAWIVKRSIGDIDLFPANYGDDPPPVAGRDVVIVDFSYPLPVLERMANQAHSIIVLDHHRTAAEDLKGLIRAPSDFSTWRAAAWDSLPLSPRIRLAVIFDMDRSGAQIAWDFFYPPASLRPPIVEYVADRDLWRWELPFSREISAYLGSFPQRTVTWDELARQIESEQYFDGIRQQGAAILRKQGKDVTEIVVVTRRTARIGTLVMPFANVPHMLTSEAGAQLALESSGGVAATYWDGPNGRVVSLRSVGSGPDVSEIAKLYGGGGHSRAAGFQMPLGWEGET